jgi:hypothetical protein
MASPPENSRSRWGTAVARDPRSPDVVLFRGPLHVITYMGEHVRALTGRRPEGDPVRLAFVERDLRESQDAMDRVYAGGTCEWVHNRYGWVHISALWESGRIVGVGAFHAYARSPLRLRLPGHHPAALRAG